MDVIVREVSLYVEQEAVDEEMVYDGEVTLS